MFENQKTKLKNLCDWYIKVKGILLIAESKSKDQQIFFQAYNELRYCLDHLMRAFAWDFFKDQTGDDKKIESANASIEKAINSSTGHLQRAYSDICEWYCLNVKQWCNDILKPFSAEQIIKAIPNYYSEIKPQLIQLEDDLVVYKENKSSESNDLTDDEEIIMYDQQFKKLSDILEIVQSAEASLVELKKKDCKSITLKNVLLPICTAVIGGIAVYIVTHF